MTCRCGHTGSEPHPCHGDGYRCRKPALRRFTQTGPHALAGMQLKFSMRETWACDECWAAYLLLLKVLAEKEDADAKS